MIKDPPPFIWSPFKNGDGTIHGILRCCPWSRYLLPCATPLDKCKGCYLFWKYAKPETQLKKGVKVTHICDKCGQEITSTPMWVRVRTRNDRTVIDRELCLACAGEIIDWLEKKA